MAIDQSQLEAALNAIIEPELGLPLGAIGMLREVKSRRRRIRIELALPVAAWPGSDELADEVHRVARAVPGVEEIEFDLTVMHDDERAALRVTLRQTMLGAAAPHEEGEEDEGDDGHGHGHGGHGHAHGNEAPSPSFLQPDATTRVIGVSSGKGGVGKSTVTVNLAVALARAGFSVGLLDADVYGFSVPKMLGTDHDPIILGDVVIPTSAHGVRCLSMGYFVPDDQPVIWRGPMLHKAIQQFLTDAYWGEPDFVLIDMPPGTGDVALTLAEVMPKAEIIVVTTPQPAAQRVAQRSAFAARRLKLSVRGVVENMSWFTGDDGARYEIFGAGGGATLAADLGIPLLGQVPLVTAVRQGADEGRPMVAEDPESETSRSFIAIADRLASLGPARVYRKELSLR
ncbi:MAG TPA: Mrp/NBP35 family ATP-binding protein [Acidimicrobiales bacterium]|jgi:ATP-binding protein involved in chromosome partitioning|nr:Mrp/NBP35 family ATP-binding protein [Acidimicrobiales bacterium]